MQNNITTCRPLLRYTYNRTSNGSYIRPFQQHEVLPVELWHEVTQAAQIRCNASECLTTRMRYGKQLITGLKCTGFNQWYSGNVYRYEQGKKVCSLLLVHFVANRQRMSVFVFEDILPKGRQLKDFTGQAIPKLIRQMVNATAS